jgi:DNA-binding MarR family transcriptional regulator/catechol 2,3-dioxygenase-like lactoylglutathione lyase family enzyme
MQSTPKKSPAQSPALGLWIVLARAFNAVQARAAENIRGYGLTPGEFGVLEALYHKGPLQLSALQRKILVTSGGMTYLVDQLEQKGLVVRETPADDKRVRLAALSDKGRALIAGIFPDHQTAMEQALSGLSRAEQEAARALLRRLGTVAAGGDKHFNHTTEGDDAMIKGLHHNAYRCRDTEETRQFYEDFLGLPLVEAFPIGETKTGRSANVLHTFFQMDDGSCLAFFEVPDVPFDFKEQHDFDLHIALTVDQDHLLAMLAKGKQSGIDTRGPADHGFVQSIYFRDPNGYVVELAAPTGAEDAAFDHAAARTTVETWQAAKIA